MERETNDSLRRNEDERSNDLRDEVLSRNQLREDIFSSPICKEPTIKWLQKALDKKIKSFPPLMIAEYELVFDITVDDAVLEKARRELRETPEICQESLKAIREMVKEDPDLVVPDIDEFYVKFLRPCKWYPKSAFHLMQRCYRFAINYPHIKDNLTPKVMKTVLSSGVVLPYPKRSIDGHRIFVIQGGKIWNPKEISLEEMMRAVMVFMEFALSEPRTQINGNQVIIDLEGLSLNHVTYFSPRIASIIVEWVQKCLPCRLKHIHIVNQPFIFKMVYAIFRPFLSEKIRNRIHFHGTNMENVVAIIGPDALSTQYGGNLNIPHVPVDEKLWERLCCMQEEFEDIGKYGYTKRIKGTS